MSKKYSVYIPHGRSKAQRDNMRQIQKDGVDPFDWKLLHKYHVEPVLRKGRYWLVTPNEYPYKGTKIHLLLIYKEAVRSPSETHPKAWTELRSHLTWIQKTYKLKGGTIAMRFGDPVYTGASVDHLHLHVIVGGRRTKNAKKLKVSAGYEA